MIITYSNIQRIDKLPFEEYLKLDGYSHSFLKREHNGITEELKITDNIIIGKLVDGIITEPSTVDMSHRLYGVSKSIAFKITNTFGDLINSFSSQVSYTCDVEFNTFVMKSQGRLDFLLPGHAVIDLKVTMSKDMKGLIEFMGYENQIWHYSKMARVDKAYLMIHSVPLKETFMFYYDCSKDFNEFWSDKVMLFGNVLQNG